LNQNWKIPSAISAISVTLHNKFSFSSKAYHDRVLCEKLCWVLQQCSVDGHLLLSGNPMYFCSDVWTISVLHNETLFSVIFNFALSFLASKVENWCNWRLCSEIKQIRDCGPKIGEPCSNALQSICLLYHYENFDLHRCFLIWHFPTWCEQGWLVSILLISKDIFTVWSKEMYPFLIK